MPCWGREGDSLSGRLPHPIPDPSDSQHPHLGPGPPHPSPPCSGRPCSWQGGAECWPWSLTSAPASSLPRGVCTSLGLSLPICEVGIASSAHMFLGEFSKTVSVKKNQHSARHWQTFSACFIDGATGKHLEIAGPQEEWVGVECERVGRDWVCRHLQARSASRSFSALWTVGSQGWSQRTWVVRPHPEGHLGAQA